MVPSDPILDYADNAVVPVGPIGPRAIFRQWEQRRLVYNAILTAVTLLGLPLADSPIAFLEEFWVQVALGAIVANVCYFVGPALESYLDWMGYRPRHLRNIFFVTGTLLACGLVILCLFMVAFASHI